MKCPVTYKQIIEYVKQQYGYIVQTCVIATVLKELKYDVSNAWNSGTASNPKKPTDRDRKAIEEAINELGN